MKISRLIKRRSVAKEVVEDGNVAINGKIAKPSSEVKVGDEIEMKLGQHIVGVKVTNIMEYAGISEAETMYEVIFQENMGGRRS